MTTLSASRDDLIYVCYLYIAMRAETKKVVDWVVLSYYHLQLLLTRWVVWRCGGYRYLECHCL
jgi:hypothetical protein